MFENCIRLKEIELDINLEHYLELDSNYELGVTEQAFILGFPFGINIGKSINPHAVWISGTIASDPGLEYEINYRKKGKKMPLFLIDSRTRQGQSGSPVIYYNKMGIDQHFNGGTAIWGNSFMKPIGIYSGRINEESDLGLVWKWKLLKGIIGEDSNTKEN